MAAGLTENEAKLQMNCSLDYSPDLRRVLFLAFPYAANHPETPGEAGVRQTPTVRVIFSGPVPKSNGVLWSQMEILCFAHFPLTTVINLLICSEVQPG